jgi:flagellar export protein FliJ
LKTKFDGIVKIKKREVENIENSIKKINNAIFRLNEKIEDLKSSLLTFVLPKSGTISQISQIKAQQNMVREEIKNLENQINVLNERKKELLEELKKANIEYEKMKYLQGEEIKKKIKEIRLKESREMDEMGYLLRGRNESE